MKRIFQLFDILLFIAFITIPITVTAQSASPGIIWSTFYSGTPGQNSGANDVAIDALGNVYMVSSTQDTDLGYNGFNNASAGCRDAIIVKFNSKGERIWASYYGGPGCGDVGKSVAVDREGNVYFAGSLELQSTGSYNAGFLIKINSAGQQVWTRTYSGVSKIDVSDVAVDSFGDIYLTGQTFNTDGIALNGYDNIFGINGQFTGKNDVFLFKINSNGVKIWGTYYGGSEADVAGSLIIDAQDNVYITGTTNSTTDIAYNGFDNTYGANGSDAFIVKFNSSGARVWGTYFGGPGEDMGFALALDTQGDFFYAGGRTLASPNLAYNGYDSTVGNYDAWLAKFTLDGQREWSTYYGSHATPLIYEACNALVVDSYGSVYMGGYTWSNSEIATNGFDNSYGGNSDGFLVKFSSSGERIWGTYLGGADHDDLRGLAVDDGVVYIAGYTQNAGLSYRGFDNSFGSLGGSDAYLMKISDLPKSKLSFISGYVYADKNGNCVKDLTELGLPNVAIRTEPVAFFGLTDANGFYKISVDSGNYEVRQLTSASDVRILTQLCPEELIHSVSVESGDTIENLNFGNTVKECYNLSVVATSIERRRCARNLTFITYTNSGLANASNVKVEVEFPENLTLLEASVPYTTIGVGRFSFTLGDVAGGEFGQIIIKDSVSCVAGILGRSLCVSATITPANNCAPPLPTWDKSDLITSASCLEDGATKLVIKNQGDGDMADSSRYVLFLNGNLAGDGKFRLRKFDSLVMQVQSNGKSIRLEANQRPDHPTKKISFAFTEGCGAEQDSLSLGYVTWFSNDDLDPATYSECLPVVDSFDPNDKQVNPEGIGDQYYVTTQTPLEYTIRFQNTGTASAINVRIVDTLNIHLDLSTLRFQGSSHTGITQVSGTTAPVLSWTFNNINLPDSASNEPASHGFVKFSIVPINNLPEKTVIRNQADIYFDYNEPVTTNMTVSTIYDIPWDALEGDKFVTLLQKPVIKEISLSAQTGDSQLLTILGLNFSSKQSENKVTINGVIAEILSGSLVELIIRVKSPLAFGRVRVENLAGWDEMYFDVTQTDEESPGSVEIYPNPNSGKFLIIPKSGVSINSINIFTLMGNEIPVQSETIGGNLSVSLSRSHQGILLVRIKTYKGTIVRKLHSQ
ncbi:MAG: SBBP repeat-containing protein [Cytophagales bacterium]|nr:SBBP repeat-containing protein [Cytophagales bacterium]